MYVNYYDRDFLKAIGIADLPVVFVGLYVPIVRIWCPEVRRADFS